MKNFQNSKFYIVGGGIASLASAAFLIRDGKIKGKNIYIFEKSSEIGGSLDAQNIENNFVCRGYRMFEEKIYNSSLDLFSFIPSIENKNKTVKQSFLEFNKKNKIFSKARLIDHGKIINPRPLGLNLLNRYRLIKLLCLPEYLIEKTTIQDYFNSQFFKSNFWFEWCTTFAFQPWHSLIEMKRYLLRFLHDCPVIDTMTCVRTHQYNENDSIILPLKKWLKQKNVNFITNTVIKDIKFKTIQGKKSAEKIIFLRNNKQNKITLNDLDFALITLGSITEGSNLGSMTLPPKIKPQTANSSWQLWEKLASSNSNFGQPSIFNQSVTKSKWESFTITCRNQKIFKLLENKTGNRPGTGCLITLKNSPWLASIVIPHQPYFFKQAKNNYVAWGHALMPDKKGDFIKKKMSDCSGKEILQEIFFQLGLKDEILKNIQTTTCIPCIMPYITSQFLPRTKKNRPKVIPKKSKNFAFLGQFVEIPNEIVFTMEQSIRSAQIAVYSLLKLKKRIPPIYQGKYNILVLIKAIKTALR